MKSDSFLAFSTQLLTALFKKNEVFSIPSSHLFNALNYALGYDKNKVIKEQLRTK